jgi:hypothetical protein
MSGEKSISFSVEQEELFIDARDIVLSAISRRCSGCSTSHIAPNRLARSIALGSADKEHAHEWARRLQACEGLEDKDGVPICHLPAARSVTEQNL